MRYNDDFPGNDPEEYASALQQRTEELYQNP